MTIKEIETLSAYDADDQTMAWRPENFCRVRPYPDITNQPFHKI